jgi:hypothetical protein
LIFRRRREFYGSGIPWENSKTAKFTKTKEKLEFLEASRINSGIGITLKGLGFPLNSPKKGGCPNLLKQTAESWQLTQDTF